MVCCDVGIMEGHLENHDTLPSQDMWPSSFHPMFYKRQKGTCDLTFSHLQIYFIKMTSPNYILLLSFAYLCIFRLHHIRTTLRIQDYMSIFAMSFIIIVLISILLGKCCIPVNRNNKKQIKVRDPGGWRRGPVVKNTGHVCKGHEFSSQQPYSSS